VSFTYHSGDAEPDYSGLFEIPSKSLRICNVPTGSPLVQPTFKPLLIPPLVSSVPIRYNVTPIPRGGASVSDPLIDSWQFDVTGWFLMGERDGETVDDVGAAFGYLCDVVCVANGWMRAELDDPSWSERRFMVVQKGGSVAYGQNPDKGEMAAGYREFVLPFIAADPIKYSYTNHSTVVTTTTVTNAGNAKVPYVVRFDGPNTDHIQVAVNGSSDDTLVYLDYALGSGEYIEISTRDGTYVSNVGIDMYPNFYVGSLARLLSPGGNAFVKSSGGGGTATVKHNDGWE